MAPSKHKQPSVQRRITGVLTLLFSFFLCALVGLMWLVPADTLPEPVQPTLLSQALLASAPEIKLNPAMPAGTLLKNLKINVGVIHDETNSYNAIFLNAGGITLKNKVVLTDLVIDETVKNGTVTLDNVVVKGRILVNGAKTLVLNDVTAVEIVVRRTGGTHCIVSGRSTIHSLTAQGRIVLNQSALYANYAGVKTLYAESVYTDGRLKA